MEQSIEVSAVIQEEIKNCVKALKRGHVVLYPSDTIWGIGCDMQNESAVERIYEIKNRKRSKPLILLVDSISMLKKYITYIHPRVETLLTHHTQPLTIIYEASAEVPSYLLNEEKTIGIRVTHDEFCNGVIGTSKQPLISTSANIAGQPTPEKYENISDELKEMVDHSISPLLDKENQQLPSVIATFNKKGELDFLRL